MQLLWEICGFVLEIFIHVFFSHFYSTSTSVISLNSVKTKPWLVSILLGLVYIGRTV